MVRLGRREVLGHDDGTPLSRHELLALIRSPEMHPIVKSDAFTSMVRQRLLGDDLELLRELLLASDAPWCEHGRSSAGTCSECYEAEHVEGAEEDTEALATRHEERYQREKDLPPIVRPLSEHAFRPGGPKTESYRWRRHPEPLETHTL